MKRQYGKIKQHLAALMLGVLLTLGSVAQAENNQGFGDVNGVDALIIIRAGSAAGIEQQPGNERTNVGKIPDAVSEISVKR